ncbi:U-actitoxin-Avd3k-like isoform X1 [Trematomus bernacchii]|uniref:U-actitoxin-Avd3k-like isoform X1 n=1 Tax=Trematomus bernacchii TaxID=40690 RepID=UPI00146B237C|nr:U-actitoxin-Avd3k-like isoform X1 [Trematomus bernacchii]
MNEKKTIVFSVLLLLLGCTWTIQADVDEDEVEKPVNPVAPANVEDFNLTLLFSSMPDRTLFNATEDCKKAPEAGACRAHMERYFYNPSTMTCEIFIYGGCLGNLNNFEDKAKCMESCHTAEDEDDTKNGSD